MADTVTVPSVPSANPPAKVQQTQVISVKLLVSGGKGVPAFNQGAYKDELPVQVPEKDAKGNPIPEDQRGTRSIETSGCGLCAWTCLLAAANCKAPVYNASAKTFSAGSTPINPSNLLQYFKDYLKTKPGANIWAGYDDGVLMASSIDVTTAVNQLVTLSNPGAPAFDKSNADNSGAAPGTDIPQVTAALGQGNPVVLAVRFGAKAGHQVLAVGIATILDKTYYVINDSGYGLTDPFPTLHTAGSSVDAATVGKCILSTTRNTDSSGTWGYKTISRYRVLGGLKSLTGLELTSTY